MSDFSHAAYIIQCTVAQEATAISCAIRSPSVLYKPALYPDGDQWCALFGENLQEGVAGFGDTPELAMAAFDEAWQKERTPAVRLIENAIKEEANEEAINNGQFGVGA